MEYEITYFYEGDVYIDLDITSEGLKATLLNFFEQHLFVKECLVEYEETILKHKIIYASFFNKELVSMSLNKKADEYLKFLDKFNVIVEHKDEIFKYLMQYPDTKELLIKMVRAATREFPKKEILVGRRYDYDDGFTVLQIIIRNKNYRNGFINKLEKLENKFINDLSNSSGCILLTTDFQQPGGK